MRMEPALEATVALALTMAGEHVRIAQLAENTDDAKDAIRIARNRLVEAYDALNQAEQVARAKYWKIVA